MPSAGDAFGPWTLESPIGSGGNAVVWKATDNDGRVCALKLINASNAGREPYRRFVTEITTLRMIGDHLGIVPVLDSYLPDFPSANDRPWLAMRLAERIDQALEGAGLPEVVDAIAAVASTLAGLHRDHGLAHRDVKPANLYRLDESWCVGDFGLVALPDRAGLTQSNKPLGPAHYIPDEMLLDPARADPFAADVYALAKSLWVLACRQNFPPQGHQPSSARGNLIADYAPHAHATALDRLIDRMTVRDPTQRPAISAVAEELEAWGSLEAGPLQIDLTDARLRLRGALSDDLVALEVGEQKREFAQAAARQFNALCAPINQALRDLHPQSKIDQTTDSRVDGLLKSAGHFGSPEIIWRWARLSSVSIGPDRAPYELRMGRGLELEASGVLVIHRFIDVGSARTTGFEFRWKPEARRAEVGTVAADAMLNEVAAEIAENLETAAGVLADRAVSRVQAAPSGD